MAQHNDFFSTVFYTHFAYTGEKRTITECRDREGAAWYRLRADGQPSAHIAATRLITQRRIQETAPNGTIKYYWETQD